MTPTAGPPETLEALFDRRAERLLAGSGPPLISITTWPFGGREAWLAALGRRPRAHILEASARPDTALVEAFEAAEARLVVLPRADGLAAEALRAPARRLPAGRRLVLFTDRVENWGALPLRAVTPADDLLTPAEASELFGERADAVLGTTDGWPGPALWAAKHGDGTESGCRDALSSEAFRRLFVSRVMDRLDPLEARILTELAHCETEIPGFVDPEVQRQRLVDDPPRLAAFEQVLRRRRWLIAGRSGLRLPRPLGRYLRSVEPLDFEPEALERELADARASRWTPAPAKPPSPDPPTASLRLELLGRPRLLRPAGEGVEEAPWRLKRAFKCLAYLALSPGRAASKEAMIADLWPDQSPEAVRRNFHPTLSEVRKTLGSPGAVVHRQGTYALGEDLELGVDVDELEVEKRAAEARPETSPAAVEHWNRVWKLYRGPLLEGIDDEWVEEPRGRFRRLYVDALRRLGTAAAKLGSDTRALDAFRALLITEPFDEPAHVAVMEIYGRSGRRDLVRRQFVNLQERLKELRVDPSPEALDSYNRWMA